MTDYCTALKIAVLFVAAVSTTTLCLTDGCNELDTAVFILVLISVMSRLLHIFLVFHIGYIFQWLTPLLLCYVNELYSVSNVSSKR